MVKIDHPIKKLAGLLEGSDARPVILASRLAPSAIYDVEYRTAIIALVFGAFAKPFGVEAQRRISVAKLKLFQFIAVRPWLLPAIREWSDGLAQGSLDLTHSTRIRRGFLSDTAYEDAVDLLTAAGVFVRHGSHLSTGPRAAFLAEVSNSLVENRLFESERIVISELAHVRVTNSMLEGWTALLAIEKSEMMRVLHREHAFSDHFISYMLSRNIRVEGDLIDQLFNSSEKRLARALLLLARYGEQDRPQKAIPTVSQDVLAEMIGTTRPRVNVFMNKFRKLGFIEYGDRLRGLQINKSLLSVVLHD
jgi:hypothetical protein